MISFDWTCTVKIFVDSRRLIRCSHGRSNLDNINGICAVRQVPSRRTSFRGCQIPFILSTSRTSLHSFHCIYFSFASTSRPISIPQTHRQHSILLLLPILRDSITFSLLEASSLGTFYCLQRACLAPYQIMSNLSKDFFEKEETSSLPPLSRMLMSNDVAVGHLATSEERRAGVAYWMVAKGIEYILGATLALLHGMIFFYSFWTSYTKGHLTLAGSTFGVILPMANAAALVLYFDLAVLTLPVCQTMTSILKKSPLGRSTHYDTNMLFHKMVGWYIVFFALVHTIGHLINFAFLTVKDDVGFKGFLVLNLGSIPGWTGYVMLVILGLIAATSLKRFRLANFERFYYSHHLFVIFFIVLSVHGICCMVKKDKDQNHAGMCGVRYSSIWQWLICGGLGYLLGERIRKEFAGRYKTHISKVIRHPGDVVEIQVKKEKTRMRIGQVCIQRSFSPLVLMSGIVHLYLLPRSLPLAISSLPAY